MELSYIVGTLDKQKNVVIGEDGFEWQISSASVQLLLSDHPFKDGDTVQIFDVNEFSVDNLFKPRSYCVVKCPCCGNHG